jgi:hypothetical protein
MTLPDYIALAVAVLCLLLLIGNVPPTAGV